VVLKEMLVAAQFKQLVVVVLVKLVVLMDQEQVEMDF
jgi:hypothetical protein